VAFGLQWFVRFWTQSGHGAARALKDAAAQIEELLAKEVLGVCIRLWRSKLRDCFAGFTLAPVFII
jgi:hypothetical protein